MSILLLLLPPLIFNFSRASTNTQVASNIDVEHWNDPQRCFCLHQEEKMTQCTELEDWMYSYYRKRGSASYIVRQWLLWEVERERDAYDVIDITLKSRVIMHMITSTARRPNALMRSLSQGACRVLECMDKELGAWALEQQGRAIDEWQWGSGSFAFAGQLPWITKQHFVGMLQARRIDQADVYFLFEWQRFCLWEQLG